MSGRKKPERRHVGISKTAHGKTGLGNRVEIPDAFMARCLLAEAADTMGAPYIGSLLDLIKAFDSVPFDFLDVCCPEHLDIVLSDICFTIAKRHWP